MKPINIGPDGVRVRQPKILDELEMSVESLGLKFGTPEYEATLRLEKVRKCRELKGFRVCSQCPAVLDCSLRLASLRDGNP